MRIAFNPSTVAALTSPPNNKDITFDLRGQNIFARGVKFYGTDTWRPVVDNLTSDSATSSLSANQGRVLAGLINGKSDSDHNHDGRYVKKSGDTMLGALNFANATWNKVGDDVYMGDHNIGGQLCIMGANSTTGLSFHKYGDASIRKSITFDGNTLYMNGNCNYAISSNQTNLLAINTVPNKTAATSIGSWSPISGRYVFHQKWTDTSTGGDTADFGIYLDGNLTANMVLDGYYNSLLGFRVIGATGGFLKANGTIDNSTYLTSHQSLSNYYTKGEIDNQLGKYKLKSSIWVPETKVIRSNFRDFLKKENLHKQAPEELNLYRFFAQNDESNYSSKYNYPVVDSHAMVFSIDGSNGYIRSMNFDLRSNDVYVTSRVANGEWRSWVRLLNTSDVAGLKGDLTVHQYLSNTDTTWRPLIWGGSSHANTSDSTGAVYKSHDVLSWQTSSQTLYATNIRTENIKHLSIGGGIYWNPNVESATDGSDAASITLVKSGVAGGTTLVLSQMNDANDTIQFKTNTAAKLYHNSYPILTTQNTYVSNHKGYINGTEITQVNNADTVDGWHKDEINRTLFITSGISGLSSYWAKLWEINLNNQYNDVTITFLAAASYYPSYFSIFSVYLRQNGTGTSKSISARLVELIGNIAVGDTELRLYVNNTTGNCQLWGNVKSQYGTMNLSVLKKAWRIANDSSNIGTFFSTNFSSVQSLPGDGWNKIGVTQQVLTGTFNPSSHTHTWTSITDKIVAGNEFNIVNAGFKGDLWFNYLPINDRSKSATISAYCFGNGNKGYTAVRASGFIKNGGNENQLLRADGGVAAFNWSGQAGQPTWLWGGNDFNSYYIYNPSNFRVTYASSAGNAETLGGFPRNYGQAPFNTIPFIGNDGVMEIGRYIDYHYDNSGKYDFSTRLQTTGNYRNVVNLPSASGTLALISQVLTWKSQIIDMRSYSESYWHPVTVPLPYTGYNKIKVSVQLNSGDKPSWATHRDGITCNMEIWATASGWGTTDSDTICLNYTYKFCSQNPCGWMQLGNPSLGVVFLRGGSRYTVYTDFDATFTPHNQKYTWSSNGSSQDTGGPYTSCPGLNFNMGAIRADLIATMVQARRVCAGHDPGIDNSISCSNWFRSSGNTGWYNTTYQGGWYMSDTSWIRAHNSVGIYTGGQIYSGSSIRMGNILLEHTDEINNITNGGINLNYRNSGNISLCQGGGNVGIGTMSPTYKLDVNGQMRTSGFHHSSVNSDNYILLAGGGYKSFGGDDSNPIFLGYLNLDHGNDGTISSSFSCLGYSVPFTYTRGGNYCRIYIPDTTHQVFYIKAATASVNYSGGGMDTWTGVHRGSGAWWLHCYAEGTNEVRVKGFCQNNSHNDSWWGGNPLWSRNDGVNRITVCIFGYVKFR